MTYEVRIGSKTGAVRATAATQDAAWTLMVPGDYVVEVGAPQPSRRALAAAAAERRLRDEDDANFWGGR